MKIQVIYASNTGNTEQIAKAVYKAIPDPSKDIQRMSAFREDPDAETYFVGFWTNRGSASYEILDILSSLHGKNIALFGTCGMGGSPEYYREIENQVSAFIPDDNIYLGAFLCQGKMPMRVREKYLAMETDDNQAQVQRMLRNFDEALLHPNDDDLHEAWMFVENVFKKIESYRKQEREK